MYTGLLVNAYTFWLAARRAEEQRWLYVAVLPYHLVCTLATMCATRAPPPSRPQPDTPPCAGRACRKGRPADRCHTLRATRTADWWHRARALLSLSLSRARAQRVPRLLGVGRAHHGRGPRCQVEPRAAAGTPSAIEPKAARMAACAPRVLPAPSRAKKTARPALLCARAPR
eukprot:2956935-Prymnesium_polylepis.1